MPRPMHYVSVPGLQRRRQQESRLQRESSLQRPSNLPRFQESRLQRESRFVIVNPSQLPSSHEVESDLEDSYDDPPQHRDSTQNPPRSPASESTVSSAGDPLLTDSDSYAGHSNGVPIIFAP
ncbi:hypothetical protein K503DRAFT_786137 [Rhizopogon vinicolor AM-OR11-026]|uniref:Uncharacterized protein n=1 Tax=Rhizopogon vinicolor AM-OR11-026 TaxID=1314800 RepID=A0A1B7MMW8_9AGAM|nr:hypothetical protein K503DRAFT_786137 [Rhizopogon vinicolor AM-OR11-026]